MHFAFWQVLGWLWGCCSLIVVACGWCGWQYLQSVQSELPDTAKLSKIRLPRVTKVYARDGSLMGVLYKERRYPVVLDQIPRHVLQCFLAAEDASFYDHAGVDFAAIARAFLSNLSSGTIREGASTITQQVIKRLFLTPEKTYTRKLQEALLAFEVERRYSKDRIFELYLNEIYFGEQAYGIEAAARTYFGCHVQELTLGQAALLAGLPKSPTANNPFRNPEKAEARRRYVLNRLKTLGWIDEESVTLAENTPCVFTKIREMTCSDAALWYLEETRRLLIEFLTPDNLKRMGVETDLSGEEYLLQAGLTVTTAMDPVHQEAAGQALVSHLDKLNDRYHFDTPVQGAIASIEPDTGDVVALIGGRRFGDSHFNRATQARRQPGSSFKPVVYSAALDNGYTPLTSVLDGPLTYVNPYSGKVWRPSNFEHDYKGWIPLHKALALSRNTCSVRLAWKIGVETVIERAKIMGFEPDFPAELSISLGAVAVSPLNMAQVYAVFANLGEGVKPRVIVSIKDSDGRVLYEQKKVVWQAISRENAYIMTRMLREVVEHGTGTRAQIEGYPISGKTGTTNKSRDAWFVGFSPYLVTSVYLGRDDMKPMGRDMQGGRAAAPVFAEYRKQVESRYPKDDFPIPETVVFEEGQPLSQEMAEELSEQRRRWSEGEELREDAPIMEDDDQAERMEDTLKENGQ